MKKFFFSGILLLFIISSGAQSKIVAQLTNLENDKGFCRACLFNSSASFNGKSGTPVQCIQAPVKNKMAQALFTNVASGTYAIFVFHDKNNNGKIDVNFLGIPKEGYGASKNKLPFAAAPAFNDNKFPVENNTTVYLTIKFRNL